MLERIAQMQRVSTTPTREFETLIEPGIVWQRERATITMQRAGSDVIHCESPARAPLLRKENSAFLFPPLSLSLFFC